MCVCVCVCVCVYIYISQNQLLLCLSFLGCTVQQVKCGGGLDYIKLGEVMLHTFLNMFVIN